MCMVKVVRMSLGGGVDEAVLFILAAHILHEQNIPAVDTPAGVERIERDGLSVVLNHNSTSRALPDVELPAFAVLFE